MGFFHWGSFFPFVARCNLHELIISGFVFAVEACSVESPTNQPNQSCQTTQDVPYVGCNELKNDSETETVSVASGDEDHIDKDDSSSSMSSSASSDLEIDNLDMFATRTEVELEKIKRDEHDLLRAAEMEMKRIAEKQKIIEWHKKLQEEKAKLIRKQLRELEELEEKHMKQVKIDELMRISQDNMSRLTSGKEEDEEYFSDVSRLSGDSRTERTKKCQKHAIRLVDVTSEKVDKSTSIDIQDLKRPRSRRSKQSSSSGEFFSLPNQSDVSLSSSPSSQDSYETLRNALTKRNKMSPFPSDLSYVAVETLQSMETSEDVTWRRCFSLDRDDDCKRTPAARSYSFSIVTEDSELLSYLPPLTSVNTATTTTNSRSKL